MGFVCIVCPRPGFECVKFSNYEFCAPFVSALYDTFIVPWCLLKQMQHDIWLFMGKWVGFGLFVSFKFWHIKGIFISLSSPFQVFIFHNELCGSECNFLHVCEQGRYCFALRQTPFWSDVVMFKELTKMLTVLDGVWRITSVDRSKINVYCTELCMFFFKFFFYKYTAVCSCLFNATFLGGCVYMCERVWRWLRNTAFVCVDECVYV